MIGFGTHLIIPLEPRCAMNQNRNGRGHVGSWGGFQFILQFIQYDSLLIFDIRPSLPFTSWWRRHQTTVKKY